MSDVYVCIYINKQARKTRGCSPRKCLEIRCFEIAFGQSRGVVATISANFWLSYMHLLGQLT